MATPDYKLVLFLKKKKLHFLRIFYFFIYSFFQNRTCTSATLAVYTTSMNSNAAGVFGLCGPLTPDGGVGGGGGYGSGSPGHNNTPSYPDQLSAAFYGGGQTSTTPTSLGGIPPPPLTAATSNNNSAVSNNDPESPLSSYGGHGGVGHPSESRLTPTGGIPPLETKYEPSHSPTALQQHHHHSHQQGIISGAENGLQYANLDGSDIKVVIARARIAIITRLIFNALIFLKFNYATP